MHQAQAQYSPRQLLESARRAEADGNIDLAAHVARYVLDHFPGSPESAEAFAGLVRLGRAPRDRGYAAPAHASAQSVNGRYVQPQVAERFAGTGFGAHARTVNGQPAAASWAMPTGAVSAAVSTVQTRSTQAALVRTALAQTRSAQVPAPLPAPNLPTHSVENGHQAHLQIPVQTIAATFAPSAPYRGPAETSAPAMIHHAPEAKRQYWGGRFVARFTFTSGWLMIFAGLLAPVPTLLGIWSAAPTLVGALIIAGALVAGGLLALLGGQTALAVFDQADSMRELVELERTRWDA